MMIVLMAFVGAGVGGGLSWMAHNIFQLTHHPLAVASAPQGVPFRRWNPDQRRLYPGAILLGALLFAYQGERFGFSWTLVYMTGSFSFFLLIALIDLQYRLVLNALVYPAIGVTLLVRLGMLPETRINTLLGGGLAFFIFGMTAWLRPGQLGGGDIKLAVLLGFAFGFPGVLWALLLGVGTGGIAAVYLILVRREGLKEQIPYAPFLCLGAIVALLYNPLLALQ
jgi:prepilin signal peptidase PulO-like enzyme (type II secretory pathway)